MALNGDVDYVSGFPQRHAAALPRVAATTA